MIGANWSEDQSHDSFWDRATWDLKFVIWPRRSEISKKHIWLVNAYRATRVWTGPGDPVFEYRWLTKDEYMFGKLKGTI